MPTRPDLLQSMTAHGYVLKDAEYLHAKNPKTFWLPSQEERDTLVPGDEVKLIFELPLPSSFGPSAERMWVRVTGKTGDTYHGIVDNNPAVIPTLNWKDPVDFQACHVIEVLKGVPF